MDPGKPPAGVDARLYWWAYREADLLQTCEDEKIVCEHVTADTAAVGPKGSI